MPATTTTADPDLPGAATLGRPRPDVVATVATVGGLVVAALLLVTAVLRLAGGFGHGIDLTDEGLYLRSADAPGPGYAYVGLWGAYLHPLFALVRYDVAVYRALGAVLLVGFALLASAGIRRALAGGFASLDGTPHRVSTVARIGLDLAVVAGALTYYSLFLITPSYNWLTLAGVLLCGAGVLPMLGMQQRRRRELLAAFLLALGCDLALMGRPTTGIGLAVLAAVLVLAVSPRPFVRRLLPLGLALAALAVLGLIHLLFFVGLHDSLDIVRRSQFFVTHDATSHTGSALIQQSITQLKRVPNGVRLVAGKAVLLGLAPLLALVLPRPRRLRAVGLLGAGAMVLVALRINMRDGFGGGASASSTMPYACFAILLTSFLVLFAAVAVDLVGASAAERRRILVRTARVVCVAGFFVLAAGLYAFSSNNGIVGQLWGAFGIFALAAVVLLVGGLDPRNLPISAAGMAVVCALAAWSTLSAGAATGYRTAAVADATVRVQVSDRGASVYTGPEYATALNQLRTGAQAAGWHSGIPLVDLTPFSPGVGYLLGSEPPTTIMLGFSPDVVRWALAQQDRTRWHDAWVLVQSGSAPLAPVLDVFGRTFPDDYERVVTISWPVYRAPLELWKPKAP